MEVHRVGSLVPKSPSLKQIVPLFDNPQIAGSPLATLLLAYLEAEF